MLQALAALSLSIGAFLLYLYVAYFWLTIWREKGSGTAHGLFLTNVAWTLVILTKVIQSILIVSNEGPGSYPYSIVAAIFVFSGGIFQCALSRGYFNFTKERESG